MAPRRTEPGARLPADLPGPVDLAQARSVETIPGESALPGGSRYEPKWDGFGPVSCVVVTPRGFGRGNART